MRILAVVSLLLATLCVPGVAASAFGQSAPTPTAAETPAIGPEDFPPLQPIAPVTTQTASSPSASGGIEPDERVLVAATYWLLLAGFALRRVACGGSNVAKQPCRGIN